VGRADLRTAGFATFAVVAALAVAGCGGASRSDPEGIRDALARAPGTYFHYRDRRWWGRPMRIAVQQLRVRGDRATAYVVAIGQQRPWHQFVSLRRREGTWHVKHLDSALVVGHRNRRRLSSPEITRVVAGRLGSLPHCAYLQPYVSRIDARYAVATFGPGGLPDDCALPNGEMLLRRTDASWKELDEGSDGFDCDRAPRGVVRSLDGTCWIARR
jgi:hypothetical protein